ncbi:PHP domain-containing protein [Pelagibacterium sp. H642]|uniref:PHP domain-containing protein n=1 Tax=Pelagibacterium sp. H642 TaxID=1881069 RepID=UPI0028169BD4|nr:PHP domain-containing protein [Pelagibacterium sp. H642]WMT90453.1 PHP domain-containing protein [Pelagibacterium sp. H642]
MLRTFSAPGRFFKGNLHTHSDRSDGALSPEEVCRRYRAAGYDFLAITDHFLRQYDFPLTDTREAATLMTRHTPRFSMATRYPEALAAMGPPAAAAVAGYSSIVADFSTPQAPYTAVMAVTAGAPGGLEGPGC